MTFYDRDDVEIPVILRHPVRGAVRTSAHSIGATGAIVPGPADWPTHEDCTVRLAFANSAEEALEARILKHGRSGIYLAWTPPTPEMQERVETLITTTIDVQKAEPVERPQHGEHGYEVLDPSTAAEVTIATQMADQTAAADEIIEAANEADAAAPPLAEDLTSMPVATDDLVDDHSQELDDDQLGLLSRARRLLNRIVTSGPDAKVEGPILEGLRDVISDLGVDERQHVETEVRQETDHQVALLEHKVQRLVRSLEQAERERDSARQEAKRAAEEAGVPLAGVQRPGNRLATGDADSERKLELLRALVEDNRDFRRSAPSNPI